MTALKIEQTGHFSTYLQKLVHFEEGKRIIDVIWQNECAYRWKVLFSLRYG